MIRTETVSLTVIAAEAYRQKLPSGGAGIVILRPDTAQPGIASIDRRSGRAIPAVHIPEALYPQEAFNEAIALTTGLPYSKRGAASVPAAEIPAEKTTEALENLEVVVNGKDYQKILDAYTDKSGKFSYTLLNRDLIRLSSTSSVARRMIADKCSAAKIQAYLVGARFRNLTGNHKLSDEQVAAIAGLLDEISPKGIFKDLKLELRKKLK